MEGVKDEFYVVEVVRGPRYATSIQSCGPAATNNRASLVHPTLPDPHHSVLAYRGAA